MKKISWEVWIIHKRRHGSVTWITGGEARWGRARSGRVASGATPPSSFALGRATRHVAYGVAIGVFESGKLAPTGRWLRNWGGEDEETWRWWRGGSRLALYQGPAVNSNGCPPG